MSISEHDVRPVSGIDLDDERRLVAARRLQPSTPGNDVLDRLSGLAARLMRAGSAQVSLLTDEQVVAGGVGLGAIAVVQGPTPRAHSLCTVTAGGAGPLVVPDTRVDPRVAGLPPVQAGAVGSYLGVPLADAEGLVVGAFCVYDREPRAWSDDEVRMLEELASATTAELERAATATERDTALLQLGLAMESGGIGSWEWDLVTRELVGDRQLLEMVGLSTDADTPTRSVRAFVEHLHPEDRPRVASTLEASIERGHEYADEYRVLLPDGTLRWLAVRGRPVHDATGAAVRLVGAAYDTTDRHLAAESVQNEASLMALIARASDLLASSLEAEDAVRSFARLVVPALADWSVVSLVQEDGRLEDVDWWHRDPARRDLTGRFARHRLEGRDQAAGSLSALATGEPFIPPTGVAELAQELLHSPVAKEAVRELDLQAVGVFPLTIEGRVIGLITLARDGQRPPFSPAEIVAAADLSRRASTALANAQSFSRERTMSERLQRSMLTAPVPPDQVEVVVRYLPAATAAQVGGDWYDAFAQDDGATVLVVGDVVGHDAVAAAVMGQLRSILRGIAVANGAGPAGLLGDLDRVLTTLQMSTNATVVVARITPDPDGHDRTLTWSNAGHPPPLMLDEAGHTRYLDSHDLLLGVEPARERHDESVPLPPGSTVVMYTDGLVERRGEDIDVGLDRLAATLSGMPSLPLEQTVDQLLNTMLPGERDDDVVVLAVRLAPSV